MQRNIPYQFFYSINKPKTAISLLDQPLTKEETISDFDVEDYVIKKIEIETLYYLLNNLSFQEKEIIYLYYGLDNGKKMKLKEIGQKYGIGIKQMIFVKKEILMKLKEQLLEIGESEYRL